LNTILKLNKKNIQKGIVMKKVFIIAFVLSVFIGGNTLAVDAVGSAFGCLSTAKALGQGKGNLGFAIGLGDNATSFVGSFDYGLSTYTNGRIKFGIYDPDAGDAGFAIGGDFRYQMFSVAENPNRPFDLAPGGFFEYLDAEWGSIIEAGALVIGSYPFKTPGGSIIAPYAKFNLRIESISPEFGDSETELKFGFNGGICFEASELIKLYGEFQIDGNDGIFLGLDYNIL
jgi:hypothetical protein